MNKLSLRLPLLCALAACGDDGSSPEEDGGGMGTGARAQGDASASGGDAANSSGRDGGKKPNNEVPACAADQMPKVVAMAGHLSDRVPLVLGGRGKSVYVSTGHALMRYDDDGTQLGLGTEAAMFDFPSSISGDIYRAVATDAELYFIAGKAVAPAGLYHMPVAGGAMPEPVSHTPVFATVAAVSANHVYLAGGSFLTTVALSDGARSDFDLGARSRPTRTAR